MKILHHRCVVFGVNCSPYLLAAVIKYDPDKSSEELKDVAEKPIRSLYVDNNCLTSVEDEEELHKFISDASALIASASFDLILIQLDLLAG